MIERRTLIGGIALAGAMVGAPLLFAKPGKRPLAEPGWRLRSEEHTSELQSLMRISYAVFCLKKKTNPTTELISTTQHISQHNTLHPSDTPKLETVITLIHT